MTSDPGTILASEMADAPATDAGTGPDGALLGQAAVLIWTTLRRRAANSSTSGTTRNTFLNGWRFRDSVAGAGSSSRAIHRSG